MGYASSSEAQRLALSEVGATPATSYAYADWWDRGDPFTLTAAECAEVRTFTSRPRNGPESWRADNFDVFGEDVRPALVERLLAPALDANERWWQLDVRTWHLGLKRYTVGRRHGEHVDLGPHRQDVKVAMSWQLSDPADYRGGALRLRLAGAEVDAPTGLGTAVCFPAWTPHLVTPVTWGTRWALVVMGVGPKPR